MIQKPWIPSHDLKVFVAVVLSVQKKAFFGISSRLLVQSPVFQAWLFSTHACLFQAFSIRCLVPISTSQVVSITGFSPELNTWVQITIWIYFLSLHQISLNSFFFLSPFTLCPCSVVLFSFCPITPGFLSVVLISSLSPSPSLLSHPATGPGKSFLLLHVSLRSFLRPLHTTPFLTLISLFETMHFPLQLSVKATLSNDP